MIKTILILLATSFAFTAFAQEPQPSQRPDKDQAIKSIEITINGRFISENPSENKRVMCWTFLDGAVHGIPVMVEVIAYPTLDQVIAAQLSALSEAEYAYIWLMSKGTKLIEQRQETAEEYLQRQARERQSGH